MSGTVFESDGTTPAANSNVAVYAQGSLTPHGFTTTFGNGHYGLNVPNGTWVVNAQAPPGDIADGPAFITVVVAGGVITSINGVASAGPANITLPAANVSGTVFHSGGTTPVPNSNVLVLPQGSSTPQAYGLTDSSGHYGVHVPNGTWLFTASPPSGDTTDAPGSITVVVAGGVITSIDGNPSAGPANITLTAANLTGTVTESDGTTPAPNTNVSVFAHGLAPANINTDSSGHYGVHVPDGTWFVTAQPPSGDTTDAATSITVVVAGGVITMINGVASAGPADIRLQVANLTGTVFESGGTTPAQNSGVSVFEQGSSTTLAVTTTNSAGHYGVFVPDGTWIVHAQPPSSDTTDGPASITVVVAGGVITMINGVASAGPANLTLPVANVSGTVFESGGTTPAQNSFVSVTAQGSSDKQAFTGTNSSGHYGLFVPDGTWVVTAQPPSNDTTDGPASITVVVAGGVITSINGNPSSGPANITLPATTSFTITVNAGSSATVGYGTAATLAELGLPALASGTVVFSSAGNPDLCTTTLPATSCDTSTALPLGSYSPITGTFTDTDGGYIGSTSTNTVSLTVSMAVPTTPTISNVPAGGTFGGGFTATVSTTGDGVKSVTSNSTGICTVGGDGLTVSYVGVGTCSLTAHVAAGTNYSAADGSAQTFSVAQAVPSTPTISNLPAGGIFGGGFTATISTTGDGVKSVTSNSTGVCTVGGDGLTVTYVGVGSCSLTAHVAVGTDYSSATGTAQTFSIAQAVPSTPTISNLPAGGTFGGGFTATVSTTGDGVKSVTSNSTGICTVGGDGLTVTYVGVGTCSLTAHVAVGTDYLAADGSAQTFSVAQAVPSTPTISNLPAGGALGGGFTATVSTTGDGVKSVTSNSTGICTVGGDGLTVTYVGVGTCSLTAHVAAGTNYSSATGTAQTFSIAQAVPSTPTISNLPAGGTFGGGFTATVSTTGDGVKSVTSNSTGVCTVIGLVVSYVGVGTCSLTAHVAAGTNFSSATGTAQTFSIAQAVPSTPTISNLPAGGTFGGGFTATVSTTGDGVTSVKSNSTGICTVGGDGLTVTYVGVGTCSLTAHVAAGTKYSSATGTAQTFSIAQAVPSTPSTPTISNLPAGGTLGGGFTATVSTTGDGVTSVKSNSTGICTVGGDGLTVTYVGVGTCSLTAHVAAGTNYSSATGTAQTFSVDRSPGYWLVASDGGIFSYGDAKFYGSTGGTTLNMPIVGMAATADGLGYWLVASDGGIFSYGDAKFYGSTGGTTLNKPIVGMAATADGLGYWLVASDGGIFSYGDAKFYGSTGGTTLNKPIVGMAATADGLGYWLVASDGGIFSYGDAKFYGSTGGTTLNKPIVGMAATADGLGYWLVASDGGIFSYGDAKFYGSTGGTTLNKPIVGMAATADGLGYWLVASDGGIFSYGDAKFYGSTGGTTLNKPIVGMAA